MKFSDKDLHFAHKKSHNNFDSLSNSKEAGCYYCCTPFPYFGIDLIKDWVGAPPEPLFDSLVSSVNSIYQALGKAAPPAHPGSKTAICPKCGTDAVLGSETGYPVTSEAFLKAMHTRWFQYTTGPAEYRGQRITAIAEAKKAGKAYALIPAQEGTPPEGCLLKPESLLCLVCGLESFNPDDVKNHYCGNCCKFMDSVKAPPGFVVTAGQKPGPIATFAAALKAAKPKEDTIIIDYPTDPEKISDLQQMMGRAGREPQKMVDVKDIFDAAKAIPSNPHPHPVTVRILPLKDGDSPYAQSRAHNLPAPKEMYCLGLSNGGSVVLDKEAAQKIMVVNTKNLEAVNSGDCCLLGKIEKELDEKKGTT